MTMQKEVKPLGGKEYFQNACKELGIDCNRYFMIGSQNHKSGNRFEFHTNSRPHNEPLQFIINYLKEFDVYIAWNLNEPILRNQGNFSVSSHKISELHDNQILAIPMSISSPNYRGQKQTVFTFNRTTVKAFLKLCMINIKE